MRLVRCLLRFVVVCCVWFSLLVVASQSSTKCVNNEVLIDMSRIASPPAVSLIDVLRLN